MDVYKVSRGCPITVSRTLILMEFGRIPILVESGRFLRHRVDISRNLRLVDLSRFPRF